MSLKWSYGERLLPFILIEQMSHAPCNGRVFPFISLVTLLCTHQDPSCLNAHVLWGTELQRDSAPFSLQWHSYPVYWKHLAQYIQGSNLPLSYPFSIWSHRLTCTSTNNWHVLVSELMTLQLMTEMCITSQGHEFVIYTIKFHSVSITLAPKVIQVFLYHIAIPFRINDVSHFCVISKFH